MDPNLSDPNNHAPQLSEDDEWDDLGELPQSHHLRTVHLPERRQVMDRPTDREPTASATAIRIEPRILRDSADDSYEEVDGDHDDTVHLEVQEIVPSEVVRLNHKPSYQAKPERQIVFVEKSNMPPSDSELIGENATWGHKKPHSQKWIYVACLGILAIILIFLALLPLINSTSLDQAEKNKPSSAKVTIEEKNIGLEAVNKLLPRQPEALQIFKAFVKARHSDEVLSTVLDRQSLTETIRAKWRPLSAPASWTPKTSSTWSAQETDGHAFGILQTELPDLTKITAYFALQDNTLLLDWKATTAYGTATFAQLEKKIGDPSEIRGTISPSEFYSSTWPEDIYQSYRLVAPDGDIAIWCYAKRDSLANFKIAPYFKKGEISNQVQTDSKATLRLARGPDESAPNQWLIAETLKLDWCSH
jgi:hypothetical protein